MNKLFISAIVFICLHFLLITLYAQDQDKSSICYQSNYPCDIWETCCSWSGGNFGCCPYAYANCCEEHTCCQPGFSCNGTSCLRSATNENAAPDNSKSIEHDNNN